MRLLTSLMHSTISLTSIETTWQAKVAISRVRTGHTERKQDKRCLSCLFLEQKQTRCVWKTWDDIDRQCS